MIWISCFTISLTVLLAAIGFSFAIRMGKYKSGRVLTPFNVMFGGVFISALFLLIPIHNSLISREVYSPFQTFLFSLFSTIQIFVIEGETDLIKEALNCQYETLARSYYIILSVYYVLAPIMSFVFLLSFFRNVNAFFRYINHYFNDAYIFSELSEKSLALGKDIKKKDSKALIIYTGLTDDNDEQQSEFIERSKAMKAICFTKDILAINFKNHYKRSKINFFSIDENEKTNMVQGLKIIEQYGNMENVRLYIFATGVESEILLANKDHGKMKVRRVNEIRSLVNRNLYDDGGKIFDNAIPAEDGMKDISVVLIGLGRYGTEMLKGFMWYCQMDGYRLSIDAFDEDPLSEDRFRGMVPELSNYNIHFHPGVDVTTGTFADEISKLKKTTFAFVALDSDEANIRTAVKLRMLFERIGIKPIIQAVVKSTYEKNALQNITNYCGQPYDIDFIGDTESSYSEEVIISSELENDALKRHLKWGKEEEFWRYEYNYQSSVASAIHMKARIHCNIQGAEKADDELTEEERTAIEKLEHRRWNAYMRSEGYIYSGSHDKASRNDLGKMHHDLIEYDLMDDEEKRKDSKVGTK
jgi:hypothetical protein